MTPSIYIDTYLNTEEFEISHENNMRIIETMIRSGYFWIPGGKKYKIPGTLTITDGGRIELDVIGHFSKKNRSVRNNVDLNRIVGDVEKIGFITLDECFYTNLNYSFGGISKSLVSVGKVYGGVQYGQKEHIKFNTISFSTDNLDEWVQISGIKVKNNLNLRRSTISFKPPKKISIKLNDEVILEIGFGFVIPGESSHCTEAKIKQNAYFKIIAKSPRTIDYFTDLVFKLTNFLCFAIDSTVTIKNLTGTSTKLHRNVGKNTVPIPISIYFQSIPFSSVVSNRRYHKMLFTLEQIKSKRALTLKKWFKAYETLSPTINLYFSVKNSAHGYVEAEFLALAQALETLHRRTSKETLLNQKTFDSLVTEILDKCPTKHQQWLTGRLSHGNEVNLRKRLKGVLEPFKEHFGNSKARSKLLSKIVDTRNYLTHYNDSLKNSSASDDELVDICDKMEVILQLHFLRIIGFTDDKISDIVKENRILSHKLG